MTESQNVGWGSPIKTLAILAFAAALAFLFFGEHRVHLLGWLPFGLILLCPLMHIFMHGGHGSHDRESGAPAEDRSSGQHKH
jgi:hypothetical protein